MKPWGCQHLRSVFLAFFPRRRTPFTGAEGVRRRGKNASSLPPAPAGGWAHDRRTPSGCTRLSELRHALFGSCMPAHLSGYAAPPLRSGILPGPVTALSDRQSCELTRLAPLDLLVVVPTLRTAP